MNNRLLLALLCSICAAFQPIQAKFAQPQPVPVDRLLKNAEAYLAAHPESSEGHYIVARIHYLAFARASFSVPTLGVSDEGMPEILPSWMISPRSNERYKEARRLAFLDAGIPGPDIPANKEEKWRTAYFKHLDALEKSGWSPPKELNGEQLVFHAATALYGFQKLVSKEPRNSLYQLGLASLLEQIVRWKDESGPGSIPEELMTIEIGDACTHYLAAYQVAFPIDSKLRHRPLGGFNALVSYEAGRAFLRLVENANKPNAEFIHALPKVKAGLAKIEKIPRGAITPIIFAMRPVSDISELLAPNTVVDFDLRGYGPSERSTWIKPDTALLVWDPEMRGKITSGQQLFGGYTFQLFRANGYDALAALDDDGDGILTGTELIGIRAWFDTNSDGKSASDEIRDLSELGIAGIAATITDQDGRHPMNAQGLLLHDGSTLPTWDWTSHPLK